VSENRKKLLLRHFGSIEKLRHATAEEISSIEGIGPKLAGTLVDFFAKLKRRGPQIEDEIIGDVPGPDESEPGVVTYQLKSKV
jgi:NAD-dependent DNA ligase